MEQSKKRLDYLDVAKGIGILLIVLGHISSSYGFVSNTATYFKISIFYIISGYLQSLSTKELSIKSKAKSLLIPYYFFSLLYIILVILKEAYKGISFSELVIALIDTLSFRGISTLWFLPTLLFAIVLHKYTSHIKPKIFVLIIIPPTLILLSYLSFWDISPCCSFYYVLYCVLSFLFKGVAAYWFYEVSFFSLKRVIEKITNLNVGKAVFVILLIVFIGGVNIIEKSHINFNGVFLGNYPCLFFIMGVIFSFVLIICLQQYKLTNKVLSFFGKHSLFVMCTHLPLFIVPFTSKVVSKLFFYSEELKGVRYYLFVLFCFISVCIIEILMIQIWQIMKERLVRIKWCSFLNYIT